MSAMGEQCFEYIYKEPRQLAVSADEQGWKHRFNTTNSRWQPVMIGP